MQTIIINTNGLQQIKNALGQFHKLGADHFTEDMLHAWAADVEQSFDNGNGAAFEIRSFDSITGRPEVVFITPDGYDIQEYDDE